MLPEYVSYSVNIFIPVTNLCRNKCAYCGFRAKSSGWIMEPSHVERMLENSDGASEALFTYGERSEEYPEVRRFLHSIGFESMSEYVAELCEMAVRHGLLPHVNPGIVDLDEMMLLRTYSASMGLMLECITPLEAHKESPGKDPRLRMRMMEDAGRLKIPFTTGILIGIGERFEDRVASLEAIRRVHEKYHHIQEVIIQPFKPKRGTPMECVPPPSVDDVARTVETARKILPEDVAIQIPPNLCPASLVRYGASDLGGISTRTPDFINPEFPWPTIDELRRELHPIPLRERLPIYPKFVKLGWYTDEIAPLIEKLAGKDGLRAR